MRAHRAKKNNSNGKAGKSAPRMIPVKQFGNPGDVAAMKITSSQSHGGFPTTSSALNDKDSQQNYGAMPPSSKPRSIAKQKSIGGATQPLHAGPHMMHHHPHHASPHSLGETKNRPIWVNDYAASNCYRCQAPFTFFFRRHHCRGCGQVFCQACTNQQCTLPHLGYTDSPVRVCMNCFRNRETLGRKEKRPRSNSQGDKAKDRPRKKSSNQNSSSSDEERRNRLNSNHNTDHGSKGALAFALADSIAVGDVDVLNELLMEARTKYGDEFDLDMLKVGMCEGEGAEMEIEEVTLLDVAARSLTPWCQNILDVLINEHGMDPTRPVNSRGDTPILVAAAAGNHVALQYLLQKLKIGSQSDIRTPAAYRTNARGETALHIACADLVKRRYPGHEGSIEGAAAVDIVKTLLSAGFDTEARDSLSRTPLHTAVAHNIWHAGEVIEADVAQCLLDAGADVNAADYKGRTALHLAAALSNDRLVACLLKHPKVQINQQDSQGNTPIHLAVCPVSLIHGLGTSPAMGELNEEGTAETLALLLQANPNTSILNNSGKAPADLAIVDQWKHMLNSVASSNSEATPTATSNAETTPSTSMASEPDRGGGFCPPSSTSAQDTTSMVY